MANVKITDLTAASTPLAGTELLEIVQSGVSVKAAAAGTYMVAPSLQFANSDTNDHEVNIWFRKNGTDIANSNTVINVPKAADGGNNFFQVVFYEQVTAAQYIEVMWLPTNVSVTLDYIAAGAIAPAAPSVILTSERIA